MDVDALKSIIQSVNATNTNSIILEFIEKRRNGLTAYVIELEPQIRNQIREMYIQVLDSPVLRSQQVDYNPLGNIDNIIETTNTNTANISLIIDNIISQENRVHDLSEMELDKIGYYHVKITNHDDTIHIFRKFNKLKKLRKGIQGYISGNGFNQLENEIVGLDNEIDIITHNTEALVINRYALQTIFDLKDYFTTRTQDAMNIISTKEKINNFQQFKDDCLSDGFAIKKVTKIVNTPNLIENFFHNFQNLPDVILRAGLSITLDALGNIEYRGTRDELKEVLSCMADSYYITLLLNEVGEDHLK